MCAKIVLGLKQVINRAVKRAAGQINKIISDNKHGVQRRMVLVVSF